MCLTAFSLHISSYWKIACGMLRTDDRSSSHDACCTLGAQNNRTQGEDSAAMRRKKYDITIKVTEAFELVEHVITYKKIS